MKQLDSIRDLEKLFEESIKDRKPVALYIEMPGFPKPEMIKNPVDNLAMKLDYYRKTYDAKLKHKHAEGVRIVGYKEQKADIVVTVELDTTKLDEAIEKLGRIDSLVDNIL